MALCRWFFISKSFPETDFGVSVYIFSTYMSTLSTLCCVLRRWRNARPRVVNKERNIEQQCLLWRNREEPKEKHFTSKTAHHNCWTWTTATEITRTAPRLFVSGGEVLRMPSIWPSALPAHWNCKWKAIIARAPQQCHIQKFVNVRRWNTTVCIPPLSVSLFRRNHPPIPQQGMGGRVLKFLEAIASG